MQFLRYLSLLVQLYDSDHPNNSNDAKYSCEFARSGGFSDVCRLRAARLALPYYKLPKPAHIWDHRNNTEQVKIEKESHEVALDSKAGDDEL